MSKKNGNKRNIPRNSLKSTQISQGKKSKATLQKIKNFFNRDNLNIFTSVVSLLLAIVAIFLSYDANSFSKNLSPLTYSYDISKSVAVNISKDSTADTSYNISDIIIDLNDNPGKIAEIYIADVSNNTIDIHNCQYKVPEIFVLSNNLIVKFEYRKKEIKIGFNKFEKLKSGYFFLILKSFSGEYYYNILHYITDDKSEYDEENKLYFTNTKIDFWKILNIYDQNEMKRICDEINSKSYTIDKLNYRQYLLQIESDFKMLKEKIES